MAANSTSSFQIDQTNPKNTQIRKKEVIVAGYLREFEQQKFWTQIIPSSIASVIMLFYPWIDAFQWNTSQHGKNVRFVDERTVQTLIAHKWAICVGAQVISSELCNWYEFEFTLNDWRDGTAMEFGFIAADIAHTVHDWDSGMSPTRKEPHYSINICCFEYLRLFGKDIVTDNTSNAVYAANSKQKFEVGKRAGDRYRARIDFQARHIKIYYNDTFVNSVYDGVMPLSVVPAVALYDGSITISNTEYA